MGNVARRRSPLHEIFSSMIGFCESATETIMFVIEGENVNNIIAKKTAFSGQPRQVIVVLSNLHKTDAREGIMEEDYYCYQHGEGFHPACSTKGASKHN